MPEDGSKPVNVAVLADAGRKVELAIPVERLERITDSLARRDGFVNGTVELSREAGRVIADVTLDAQLTLRCQRCLGLMLLPIDCSSRVVLIESEAAAADVPPELETALAPEGRMRLADLVEEELLLALPAAPRHEGQCPGVQRVEVQESISDTTRPFAGLGDLLSGRSKQ
jgi:uncharacterized protein